MTVKAELTWQTVDKACDDLATRWSGLPITGLFGVPTGGAPVALMTSRYNDLPVLDEPGPGCLVVDDLVDSGRTLTPFHLGGYFTDALYRKPWSPDHLAPHAEEVDRWLVFPWERREEGSPTDAVVRLLSFIGEDPLRPGLRDTPDRVCRALSEMTAGYDEDPAAILTRRFEDTCDEMVVLRGIDFTSLCEHHLLPFVGTAAVAYVPGDRVVGLSKLARLVECFARRLQVQERMTQQIAGALAEHLEPRGVGVVVRARHSCMGCRGVRKAGAEMVTSALSGYMKEDPKARAEFLALADG